MAKNEGLQNAAKQQPLRGYLIRYEPDLSNSSSKRLHFIVTGMAQPLLLRLLKYVAVSYPVQVTMLGPATVEMQGAGWIPDRLSLFLDPKRFNDDREDKYWCLLNKVEALSLLRDWQEDPRYTEKAKAESQNYFKNMVDTFENHMENRKWSQ